jgi:hypothetical protein
MLVVNLLVEALSTVVNVTFGFAGIVVMYCRIFQKSTLLNAPCVEANLANSLEIILDILLNQKVD